MFNVCPCFAWALRREKRSSDVSSLTSSKRKLGVQKILELVGGKSLLNTDIESIFLPH
jgi:hypothetical protein